MAKLRQLSPTPHFICAIAGTLGPVNVASCGNRGSIARFSTEPSHRCWAISSREEKNRLRASSLCLMFRFQVTCPTTLWTGSIMAFALLFESLGQRTRFR